MKKIILIICLLLCACAVQTEENQEEIKEDIKEDIKEEIKKEKVFIGTLQDENGDMILPLNTEVFLTYVRQSKKDVLLNDCQDILFSLHKLLDRHHYYLDDNNQRITNLRVINEHFNEEIVIDSKLFDALKQAIELTKLTKGYFNLAIGKLSDVYDGYFNSYDIVRSDPPKENIDDALNSVIPYEDIDKYIILNEENKSITLKPYNGNEYIISLGGFSKGYVVDQIYNELTKYNTSFMVSAGSSSIMAYVYEDEGISWKVGSKDPNNKDSLLYAYPLMNEFTSSSGDYEQYYINEDNILRHHILNPYTGYSENYYRAVELKSNKNSGAIDALSTAIFSIGDIDQIIDIINNIESYYDMKVDYCLLKDDYSMIINKEFADVLIESYTSNKISEVIIK